MKMKHILTKSLGLLLLFGNFFSLELKADEVRIAEINKVAVNAFSVFSGKMQDELEIIQIIPVTNNDTTIFYVVNFEKGFIIISADNIAEPILGYGINSSIDFDDMPPALNYLFDGFKEEIVFAKRQRLGASQEISAKWYEYLNPNPSRSPYIPATYLIQTTWGQNGGGGVGYNYIIEVCIVIKIG